MIIIRMYLNLDTVQLVQYQDLYTCILDLLAFTMFPVQLKTLSEGTLVAGIHKYFVAKHDKTLYRKLLSFHHSNGL